MQKYLVAEPFHPFRFVKLISHTEVIEKILILKVLIAHSEMSWQKQLERKKPCNLKNLLSRHNWIAKKNMVSSEIYSVFSALFGP